MTNPKAARSLGERQLFLVASPLDFVASPFHSCSDKNRLNRQADNSAFFKLRFETQKIDAITQVSQGILSTIVRRLNQLPCDNLIGGGWNRG